MTGLLKTPIVWRALMAAWLDKARPPGQPQQPGQPLVLGAASWLRQARCHPAVHRVFAGAA